MLPVAKPQGAYILARGCSIDQVHEQVERDDHHGREDDHALDCGRVVVVQRLDRGPPEPGQAEDRLGEQGPAHRQPNVRYCSCARIVEMSS